MTRYHFSSLLLAAAGLTGSVMAQCSGTFPTVSFKADILNTPFLIGDGLGTYVDQEQNAQVHTLSAFNIWAFRPITKPYKAIRSMTVNLTQPAGDGAVNLGSITNSKAEFHAFHHLGPAGADGLRPITRPNDAPEGSSLAERVEIWVYIRNIPHLLIFGHLWPKNTCAPGNGTSVWPGQEATTTATLVRTGDVLEFSVPPGSIGRLWNYKNTRTPVNLGLYYFDFRVRAYPK